MATVSDIARDLLGSLASDASMPIAVKWIDNRYKQLVGRVKFRHLRRVGGLYIPGSVTTGTITMTQGSTTLTGSSTTWTTSPGAFSAGAQPYYFIRTNATWYEISAITGDEAGSLSYAYADSDVTDSSYTLIKRYHALPSTVRWLGAFAHERLGTSLGPPISLQHLDAIAPRRTLVGSPPAYVAQKGTNSSGALVIEIYPFQSTPELLHYVYWDLPTTLDVNTTIPPQIDPYILKEGAYIDYCRYQMALKDRAGKLEATAFWRNEFRAAETRFDAMIRDAVRTDRGDSDAAILQRSISSSRRSYDADIKTATQDWLLTYNPTS